MKLIFCPQCQDLRKLQKRATYCQCRKSHGWYDEDGIHAYVAGQAIPVGVDNRTFSSAIRQRPTCGLGPEFVAFVFPESTKNITQLASKNK